MYISITQFAIKNYHPYKKEFPPNNAKKDQKLLSLMGGIDNSCILIEKIVKF